MTISLVEFYSVSDKVTISHRACCATRCSAMKPSKLKRHADGKHPKRKEKDLSLSKENNFQNTTVNCETSGEKFSPGENYILAQHREEAM